jgi:hypothetical protein
MTISTYLNNKLGGLTFLNTAYTTPGTNIWLSLHDDDPGLTGANEVSGGTYAREQVSAWNAPALRAITNTNDIVFDTLTVDLGTAAYLGAWDASTSGNFLWYSDAFSLPLTVGAAPSFEAGNVSIYMENEISTYLAHKWLNHVFRNTAFTTPGTSLYTSLHTASPGLVGSGEVAGNNYGRIQYTAWAAFVAGRSRNTTLIQFATPSANWGSLQGFGIYDASSSGNFLAGGALATAYEALSGDANIAFGASEFNLVIS